MPRKIDPDVPPVVAECFVPSCGRCVSVNPLALRRLGWRCLKASMSLPPNCKTGRQFLGWCPVCSIEYHVEEEPEA